MMWSTPIRRSGTIDLSSIPNEIYMEIFSYLRPSGPNDWLNAETRQHFCNLALVCRFFSSVMLPWIFENLTFVEKSFCSQIRSPVSSTVSAKFCRSILDGDTTALLLAKHVKHWEFLGSPGESKWTPAFLSMYFETFQRMPNLLEVSLRNIVISKDFFKRLANVPTLETLKLDTCSFGATNLERHVRRFELLPLKQLSLSHPIRNCGLKCLIPYLNMSTLTRLELDVHFCFENMPLPNNSLPLEYLYLYEAEDPLRLAEFLEKTPCLRTLRILWASKEFTNGPSPGFTLGPQVIPRLIELEAACSLCVRILPGRPVSRLGLLTTSGEWKGIEVKDLCSSTKTLIHLRIPSALTNHPFWKHFPDLENIETRALYFNADAWGRGIESTFKGWGLLPNLRCLGVIFPRDISTSAIDSQEREVLDFLNAIFPNLTRVDFSFCSAKGVCQTLWWRYVDTWSYSRVIGGSWHRTFRFRDGRLRMVDIAYSS